MTDQPGFSQIMFSYPVRMVGYAAFTMIGFLLLHDLVWTYGGEVMATENGPIESAQVSLAVLSAVCLFYAASLNQRGRAGLIACGAAALYAAAREADAVFERWLFHDAYQVLIGLPMLALVLWAVIAQRKRLISDTMWLMSHPAATLFIVAGIHLGVLCQMLDRPGFWNLSESPHDLAVKKTVEESVELFAYLLIAFSAIEAVIVARQSLAAASATLSISNQPKYLPRRVAA